MSFINEIMKHLNNNMSETEIKELEAMCNLMCPCVEENDDIDIEKVLVVGCE